jgi:type I restriction-modification system DNA methylase subunit
LATEPLETFALRLVNVFQAWQSVTGESAESYFVNPQRHGGDEHTLRVSLVKDHVLQQGFGYSASQIELELEATDRADVVLFSGGTPQRPVAIVETKKSGFSDLLHTSISGETPPQQLARYLRLRGMYLGAITNGETWHFFDVSVGLEPRASLHLLDLVTTLAGATTPDQVKRQLTTHATLRYALVVIQDMFEATKWGQIDHFLDALRDEHQFHAKQLITQTDQLGLIEQIRHELHGLRNTILAQFTLLRAYYATYQQRLAQVSHNDDRDYETVLAATLANILKELSAYDPENRATFSALINQLCEQFMQDGDEDAFSVTYAIEGQQLLKATQWTLPPELEPSAESSAVRLPSLAPLLTLLSQHRRYVQEIDHIYASSIRLEQAYQIWRQQVRGVFAAPDEEFCLQTSYIHFVRLFFVRVCEDYGLIQRRISNGPLSTLSTFDVYRQELLEGISDVYNRLLEESFERTASIYHNFFHRDNLYDWFKLDERTILSLLAVLNRYDFSAVTLDVLGTIYNEGYIEEQRRSELGQFYTPHQVVTYMINSLGIPNPDPDGPITEEERQLVETSVIDLSCGSGSFLVEIAARKSIVLQKMVANGEISSEDAVEYIAGRIAGIDINPFACYLAEMNLFIRCMPFLPNVLPNGQKIITMVQHLLIFCGDSIEPTQREIVDHWFAHHTISDLYKAPPLAPSRPMTGETQLLQKLKNDKTLPNRFGHAGSGFDVVLGNPPYVRADESEENKQYRQTIRAWQFYPLRTKWDLFVPFVYRSLQFLAPDGHLALITSSAIETEGYAHDLRAHLLTYALKQIDFFPRVTLFEGVGIHNTIFVLRNRQQANAAVRQRMHQDETGTTFTEQTKPQSVGAEVLFRHAYKPPPPGMETCTIPLAAIAYTGTGLEAHSHEKFDPIQAGKRVKLFDLKQSFPVSLAAIPPNEQQYFTDRGVIGDDVGYYYLRQTRYVAYDYMKEKMRGRRLAELFRTPQKLLIGKTSGGYYDTDELFANHTVQVVVPWHVLQAVAGIQRAKRLAQMMSGIEAIEAVSASFDLRYLLAIINSHYMREYITTTKIRSTRGEIYPDDWKNMPVKVVSQSTQATIAKMVETIQAMYRTLAAMQTTQDVYQLWQQQGRISGYLKDYLVAGRISTFGPLDKTKKQAYAVTGDQVLLYANTGILVTDPTYRPLLAYFCWYCYAVAPHLRGYSWDYLRQHIPIPSTLEQVKALLIEVEMIQQKRLDQEAAITAKRAEIEQAVREAYASGGDARLWAKIEQL